MNKELKDYPNQQFLEELERRIFITKDIEFQVKRIDSELQVWFSFLGKEGEEGIAWIFKN